MSARWLSVVVAATVNMAPHGAMAAEHVLIGALPGASASFAPIGPALPETLSPSASRPSVAAPDEGPLWRLLHAGRLAQAQRLYTRLRRAHEGWRPSRDLVQEMRARRLGAELQAVLEKDDPRALIAFARRHPDQFRPRHVDRLWALAEAHHRLKEASRVRRLLKDMLAAPLTRAERAATLHKARAWLATDDYLACLQLALKAARDRAEVAHLGCLWYESACGALAAALQAGERDRADRLSRELAPHILARQDVPQGLGLGWLALNRRDLPAARAWFERVAQWRPEDPDAAYGLAIVASELSDAAAAERWARKARLSQEGPRRLLATLVGRRAHQAYEDQLYEDALALLDELERMVPLSESQLSERAWAMYHRGSFPQSAEAFVRAFAASPGDETASGLFYSHLKADRLSSLDPSMPQLVPLFRRHAAQGRYYQKQFLTARRLAPEDYPSLQGLDGPTLGAGGRIWRRSGDAGTSALTGWAVPAADVAIAPGGLARLRLQIDRLQIDGGTLVGAAAVGSFPDDGTVATLQPAYAWFEPRLHVSYADGAQYDAVLGLAPVGTTLAPLPTMRLGVQADAPWGPVGLSAFALPVQDSALSWLGMPDPYGGEGWGRTYRYGFTGSQRLSLGGDYQLQLGGLVARLQGERVAPNHQGRLEVGVQRDLRLPHLDFGVLGLQASYERYQLNLGHFTVGHGGYYSPQLAAGSQLTWDARTPESEPWMLSMHVGTGPSYHQLDAAPYFPLSPDGRVYEGSAQWTWGVDGELKAAYLLGDRWQVGASLQFARTPSYDQQALMVVARYGFAARRALVSDDLP